MTGGSDAESLDDLFSPTDSAEGGGAAEGLGELFREDPSDTERPTKGGSAEDSPAPGETPGRSRRAGSPEPKAAARARRASSARAPVEPVDVPFGAGARAQQTPEGPAAPTSGTGSEGSASGAGSLAEAAARFAALVPGSDTPLYPAAPPAASAPQQPQPQAAEPVRGGAARPERRGGRLAAARELIGADDGTGAPEEATWLESLQRTQAERERLWPTISAVLAVISAEPSVSQQVGTWKLSRDETSYRTQRQQLELALQPVLYQHDVAIGNPRDTPAVFDAVYDELIGIGPLGDVWRDDTVTEILVDGWDRIAVEKDGELHLTPLRFRDREHAARLARDLATSVSDRALNITNPLVTAELERARANFAYGPVVKSGLAISIRKFRPLLTMEKLLEVGALDPDMSEFLRQAISARATLIVSGGTGTGKTTMLNALSEYVPDTERVVTIEDSFELDLRNQHVVSLQTKERASGDDEVRIGLADLLVNALRMRPDRIVVGEIREPNGARAMLQAATTGHDGTMTTIHANTPTMALGDRLSDLLREATGAPDDVCKRTVATAIHLVVQVIRRHGRRYISEIAVVDRSMAHGGEIRPEPLFSGDVGADGQIRHRQVGSLGGDTDLATKLRDAGFPPERWQLGATPRPPEAPQTPEEEEERGR